MIDITLLENAFGKDISRQLLALYLDEHGECQTQMNLHFNTQDCDALGQTANTLSSALSNLFEVGIISQLQHVEQVCKNGALPTSGEIEVLSLELNDISNQMKTYLA